MPHVYRQTLSTRSLGSLVGELLHEKITAAVSDMGHEEEEIAVDVDDRGDIVVTMRSPDPVDPKRLYGIGQAADIAAHDILLPRTVPVTRLALVQPERAAVPRR